MLWFYIVSPDPYISNIKTAAQSTVREMLTISPEIDGGDAEMFLFSDRKDFLCLDIRKLWHAIPRNCQESWGES